MIMKFYDEKLQEMAQRTDRKRKLEAEVADLRAQEKELREKTQELLQKKQAEESDVERLEGISLAGLFYSIIGKKDEKMSTEQREAYEAAVKYKAAALELDSVKEDIERKEAELLTLENCEEEYDRLLEEKEALVKASDVPEAEKIMELEKQMTWIEGQRKEVAEAVAAGRYALQASTEILSKLDSAHSWGTWDLIGGGLLTDMMKHSRLDEAQRGVEELQVRLRRFKTELADVKIEADAEVSVNGFLRFADYFFDGLFVDWAVLDKINRSREQIQKTDNQIRSVLQRLHNMDDGLAGAYSEKEEERDRLVLAAQERK